MDGHPDRPLYIYNILDDRVYFATPDQLRPVFPHPDPKHVRIGCLAAAEEVPLSLEASRFVGRHAAVVGSTGSGKTSAVASLLQNFVKGGWRGAANIVVIDPHGEYARALDGNILDTHFPWTMKNSRFHIILLKFNPRMGLIPAICGD